MMFYLKATIEAPRVYRIIVENPFDTICKNTLSFMDIERSEGFQRHLSGLR